MIVLFIYLFIYLFINQTLLSATYRHVLGCWLDRRNQLGQIRRGTTVDCMVYQRQSLNLILSAIGNQGSSYIAGVTCSRGPKS